MHYALLPPFHEIYPHASLKTPQENTKNPSYFRVILKLIFRYEKKFKSPNAEDRHKTWLKNRRYGKRITKVQTL